MHSFASKRSWITAVVPSRALRTRIANPAMWKRGSTHSQRSPGSVPIPAQAAAAAASWLPAVSSTGFGSPVVPEVNSTVWTAEGSSSVRSSGSASSPSSGESITVSAPARWACRRCSASGRRVFTGTSAAPRRGTAWSSTAKSSPGGSVVATRSPSPTPSAARRRAVASASESSWE